jgi:hypothetical protein
MPYLSNHVEKLQNDIRKLAKQTPSIEYELSVLSDVFCHPIPNKTDIRKARINLAMVNQKEPNIFLDVIEAIKNCSNKIPNSNWPGIISDTVNRYF